MSRFTPAYSPEDLAVKDRPHHALSRLAALQACAAALVAAAREGRVSRWWVLAFVRGVLRLNRTHARTLGWLEPIDLLVAEALEPTDPAALWATSLNRIDPPQAAEPPEIAPNAAVCERFLAGLAPGARVPSYFSRPYEPGPEQRAAAVD